VILRDRDGGLWIGTTDRGLVHMHQGRMDVLERSDGLSGDFVERLFEDREGDIWVATLDGLDRFRDLAVPTISVKQGLSNATVESVLAARDGSLWLGTVDGLNRWDNGRITVYRKGSATATTGSASGAQRLRAPGATIGPGSLGNVREIVGSGLPDDAIESLFQDFRDRIWVATRRGVAYLENGRFTPVNSVPGEVESIAGDRAGNLWLSQRESFFHLRDGRVIERTPWAKLGRPEQARSVIADPLRGGLWLGFRGALAYFQGGEIRTLYTPADGLGEGHIRDLQLDGDGTVWASTAGGLSRLKDSRIATLTSKNGLPCDDAHWLMEDQDHTFWLYMACGLVRIARTELDAWAADPRRTIRTTVFDGSDGVRGHSATTGFSPSVARSADGKLWFLPFDGVSVFDPHHLPSNNLPPPVHIEQITADRKIYNPSSNERDNLNLPPLVRDLEIDYTALCLVAPEKVLFRYKLEGWDRDWQDVGNRRQAFYSNLSPGNYRFRVAACNNSGVWNDAGASFDFSIAAAYYQTGLFQALWIVVFLALTWALYRYRLHQIAKEFNVRLEERVGERTRIARDLHDTLLQSFHGLMFRLQATRNMLPRRPEEAIQALDGAITRAEQAITEGRNAIQGLRSEPSTNSNLEHLLTATGQELAGPEDANHDSANFRVTVEGEGRDLSPILQDEVYRIVRELLRNAFQHAQARQIEAEILYDDRLLRLRIRDDGKGMDPTVLQKGARAGHWGLPGIRERAKQIGAQLYFWSEVGAGTEVELTVPASVAYAKSRDAGRFRIFRKKTGTHAH
jgi:signal transduction histidine kinase